MSLQWPPQSQKQQSHQFKSLNRESIQLWAEKIKTATDTVIELRPINLSNKTSFSISISNPSPCSYKMTSSRINHSTRSAIRIRGPIRQKVLATGSWARSIASRALMRQNSVTAIIQMKIVLLESAKAQSSLTSRKWKYLSARYRTCSKKRQAQSHRNLGKTSTR